MESEAQVLMLALAAAVTAGCVIHLSDDPRSARMKEDVLMILRAYGVRYTLVSHAVYYRLPTETREP